MKNKFEEYTKIMLACSNLILKTPELIKLTRGEKVKTILIVPGKIIKFTTKK